MAEAEGSELQRKVAYYFFMLLLVSGVLLYWFWGLAFDTWSPFTRGNIGIYTIYSPLIAFGLIGMLLYRRKKSSG